MKLHSSASVRNRFRRNPEKLFLSVLQLYFESVTILVNYTGVGVIRSFEIYTRKKNSCIRLYSNNFFNIQILISRLVLLSNTNYNFIRLKRSVVFHWKIIEEIMFFARHYSHRKHITIGVNNTCFWKILINCICKVSIITATSNVVRFWMTLKISTGE